MSQLIGGRNSLPSIWEVRGEGALSLFLLASSPDKLRDFIYHCVVLFHFVPGGPGSSVFVALFH